MHRQFIITAAVFGIVAVVFGAFGAHGLKEKLTAAELENWKTAVSYQFWHTLAILFLANLAAANRSYQDISFYCFAAGILLFSGSLYLLATRSLTGIAAGLLGPVTPLGGLCFIAGWIFLLLSVLKTR